ncbi:hypothetical protein GCM10028777_04510 [Angustibacter speluncae]
MARPPLHEQRRHDEHRGQRDQRDEQQHHAPGGAGGTGLPHDRGQLLVQGRAGAGGRQPRVAVDRRDRGAGGGREPPGGVEVEVGGAGRGPPGAHGRPEQGRVGGDEGADGAGALPAGEQQRLAAHQGLRVVHDPPGAGDEHLDRRAVLVLDLHPVAGADAERGGGVGLQGRLVRPLRPVAVDQAGQVVEVLRREQHERGGALGDRCDDRPLAARRRGRGDREVAVGAAQVVADGVVELAAGEVVDLLLAGHLHRQGGAVGRELGDPGAHGPVAGLLVQADQPRDATGDEREQQRGHDRQGEVVAQACGSQLPCVHAHLPLRRPPSR